MLPQVHQHRNDNVQNTRSRISRHQCRRGSHALVVQETSKKIDFEAKDKHKTDLARTSFWLPSQVHKALFKKDPAATAGGRRRCDRCLSCGPRT